MSRMRGKVLVGPGQVASVGDNIPSNPFSTNRIQPGAIPYIFPPNENVALLVSRLRANAWRGQIIGAHGTGKSSLVAALLSEIARAGRQPILVTLHDGEHSLAAHHGEIAQATAETVLIVDGFEQLAFWNKWRVRAFCRRRTSGLLVTAHASVGLPMLMTTAVDQFTAEMVLQSLLPRATANDRAELHKGLAVHGGNLRDALFDLYDLHELRRQD
jgi:hypothetical protein